MIDGVSRYQLHDRRPVRLPVGRPAGWR